ncbi:hypothetical protein KBD08_03055 [Candidatus Babeliales bacterium]|nr:hypothetical protein [Candidatus Babeliales bacterium]
MKRICFVLLNFVGMMQGSFNPLLLKGTTRALEQAVNGLTKVEQVKQGKVAKAQDAAKLQQTEVARKLTDAEKKLYTDCAPFGGLMYIEKGVAEQWYRLSPKYLFQDLTPEQLAKFKVQKIATENNAIENLITQMYHIAGTDGLFAVTNAVDNPVRLLTSKDIGSLLHIIASEFDKQGKIKHEGQFKAAIEDKIYGYLLGLPSDSKMNQNTESKRYKKNDGKAFTKKDFGHFVNALVTSVVECRAVKSKYPKNTPQHLLISYMLAKSEKQGDLQEYVQGLLGDDTFMLPAEEYDQQDIKAILEKSPDLKDTKSFADYVCAAIFKQSYMSMLPKMAYQQQVKYHDVEFTNCVEAMMENLVNIATYGHGDSDTTELRAIGKVNSDKQQPELQQFYASKLAHVSNVSVNHNQVHQDWLALFENKEGVIYKNVVDQQNNRVDIVDLSYDGFIAVSEKDVSRLPVHQITVGTKSYDLYEKQIGTKKYLLVPPSSGLDCFEMRAKPSNVVMIMSRLFDVGVSMSVSDIFNLDTVTDNFQTMCDALGWHVDPKNIADIKEQKDPLNINVEIRDGDKTESFDIKLLRDHGGIYNVTRDGFTSNIQIGQLAQADKEVLATCVGSDLVDYFKLSDVQKLNVTRFVSPYGGYRQFSDNIQTSSSEHDSHEVKLIQNLLLQPNGDYEYAFKMMVNLVQQGDLLLYFDLANLDHEKMTVLAKEIIEKMVYIICVTDKFTMMIKDILDYEYVSNDKEGVVHLIKIVKNMNVLNQDQRIKIVELLDDEMLNSVTYPQNDVLTLMTLMIDQGLAQKGDLIKLASKAMSSSDAYIRQQAITYLPLMIDQGVIDKDQSNEMIGLVDMGMKSSDIYVQHLTMQILKSMIDKGIVGKDQSSDLIKLASKAISSSNGYIRQQAITYLLLMIDKGLIDKDQSNEMIGLVDMSMKSSDAFVQHQTMPIVKSMIDKDIIGTSQSKEMIGLVDMGMKSSDVSVQHQTMQIVQLMIDKGIVSQDQVSKLINRVHQGLLESYTDKLQHEHQEQVQAKDISESFSSEFDSVSEHDAVA